MKNDIESQNLEYDVDHLDYERKHRIGTRLMQSGGELYRYAKIDLGSLGKIDGKAMRHVWYQWIPWNGLAKLKEFRKTG